MQATYQKTTVHGHVCTETAAEHVLPDYQGDIKKVLSSTATVIPAGKFISGTEAQLSGSVAYDILYADAQGQLTSAQFSSDYELSVPVSEDTRDAVATVTVDALTVRLSGPRRISVKAHICACTLAIADETVAMEGDALSEERSPETRELTLSVRRTLCGEEVERSYADGIAVRELGEEHVQPIRSAGSCRIDRVACGEGEVTFTAEVVMQVLLLGAEGNAQCLSRTVSTEECIPLAGAHPGMTPTVHVGCCTVTAMTEGSMEGEQTVGLRAQLTFTACAEENAPLTLVTDAYLCDEETEISYGTLSYEACCDMRRTAVSAAAELPCASLCDGELRELLCPSATVRSLRGAVDNEGRLCLEGELSVQTIGVQTTTEGDGTYVPIRAALPFSYTLEEGAPLPAQASVELDLMGIGAEGVIDGDTVRLSATVHTAARLYETKCARYVASLCGTGERPVREGAVITVYYPTSTDTLWDVARTYRTTVRALAQDNGLDAVACLAQGATIPAKQLLIFK